MKRQDREEQEIIDRLEGGHWSPLERPRLSHGEKQLIAQQLKSQLRRQPMFKKSQPSTFNILAGGVAFMTLLVILLGVWSAVMRPEVETAVSATGMPPTVPQPTTMSQLLPVELTTVTPISSLAFDRVWPEMNMLFAEYNVEGAFVLYQQAENGRTRINPIMSEERFTPASTFKILNALIGLERGVIPDVDYELEWDGTMYGIPEWEQEHTLQTAMASSAVWYYQELARRVGEEQMAANVSAADYGNKDTAGEIDQFWLNGQLQISAVEQVEFLRRLYAKDLPFSMAHQEAVKEMMLLEQTEMYALYGKTGWGQTAEGDIGWFVGFVETADDVAFFATVINSDSPSANFGEIRLAVTKALLETLQVVPEFDQQ